MNEGWHRPTLRAFLPELVGGLGPIGLVLLASLLGRDSGDDWWDATVPLVALVLYALAVLWDWLFTRWRITPEAVEVRRGLVSRRHLTIARERVRSVDSQAGLLKRLFGVVDLAVGTGDEGDQLKLKGLAARDVAALRTELLRGPRRVVALPEAPAGPSGSTEVPVRRIEVLASFAPGWLRLAPFTPYGLAAVVVLWGLLGQLADALHLRGDSAVERWIERQAGADLSTPLVLAGVLLGLVGVTVPLAVVAYAVRWWGLHLERSRGHLTLRYGLLSTRTVTLEETRVRGVRLLEPVLLAPARGARLTALATGTTESRSVELLPAVPRDVARQVAGHVARSAEAVRTPLVPPVTAAVRRRLTRAQWLTAAAVAGLGVAAWLGELPWWAPVAGLALVPLGVAVGLARARHLGYALTSQHLVVGPPHVARERVVLDRAGVIGWVVKESFFQRRRGLATLVAATAAGSRGYALVDLPREQALALAAAITPDALRSLVR